MLALWRWNQQMVIWFIYYNIHSPTASTVGRSEIWIYSTWWLIPLSKWVITPVISGISRVNPLITGVITHLLSGMSHQVDGVKCKTTGVIDCSHRVSKTAMLTLQTATLKGGASRTQRVMEFVCKTCVKLVTNILNLYGWSMLIRYQVSYIRYQSVLFRVLQFWTAQIPHGFVQVWSS